CRVGRKARTAAQDFRQGQIVKPHKVQAIVKSLELLLEFLAPEFADLSRAHHHEHLLGLGQQLQDVVYEPGKIVGGRDGGVVLAKRRVCQVSLIDRREQERCVGKELPSIFAREQRRRAGKGHDEVGLGTISVGGTDEV